MEKRRVVKRVKRVWDMGNRKTDRNKLKQTQSHTSNNVESQRMRVVGVQQISTNKEIRCLFSAVFECFCIVLHSIEFKMNVFGFLFLQIDNSLSPRQTQQSLNRPLNIMCECIQMQISNTISNANTIEPNFPNILKYYTVYINTGKHLTLRHFQTFVYSINKK